MLVPWEVLKAGGVDAESAGFAAAGCLALLALAALLLCRAPSLQKQFYVGVFRESFSVPQFLRAFAWYAFALLGLAGGIWLFLEHHAA